MSGSGKLLIAIPALNEEASIEAIIRRSLAAREAIISQSPVGEVEITVVSDGSSDRTVELARRYASEIDLIVFEANRGYGAAIKEAWARSDAELLGFLDADGTCDPEFFAPLCSALSEHDADVALGCRLTPNTKMPVLRKLGNRAFSSLLSLFSSRAVNDSASGMRVVRRSSLPRLFPLPDGLHFTPAMSARAVLSPNLEIVEIPMPYHERQGESKLEVLKDGLRFLSVIVEAAFLHRPSRPLGLLGLLGLLVAIVLMIEPTHFYLVNRSVEEWMIYRFVVSHLAATNGVLLLCISYLSASIVELVLGGRPRLNTSQSWLRGFFSGPLVWIVAGALSLTGGLLVFSSFLELLGSGETYEHWSRYIAMSFAVSVALILIITRLVDYILDLLRSRVRYLESNTAPASEPPRTRTAAVVERADDLISSLDEVLSPDQG